MRISGSLLVLLSAAAFGAMAVFGTLAYEQGSTVGTLLSARFLMAAAVSWLVLLASRARVAELRSLSRRDVALALGLGACGYAGQAGGYFTALERIDASLLSLLVYTYPAIVAVAAVALGRDRLDGRRVAALALASGGLALVVAGAGTGALDPLGTALGIGTAFIYSAYLLTSEPVAARLTPHLLSALVCTGAGATLTAASAAVGQLRPGEVTLAGWGWLACLAIVSTVIAVALFFAGLRRVGPTTAALLSTLEPVVTVVLAVLAFGDVMRPAQVLGGVLVLGAVLVLYARSRPLDEIQPAVDPAEVEHALDVAGPAHDREPAATGAQRRVPAQHEAHAARIHEGRPAQVEHDPAQAGVV
jgi:drug/metabolite transporter (DMT)-like permease